MIKVAEDRTITTTKPDGTPGKELAMPGSYYKIVAEEEMCVDVVAAYEINIKTTKSITKTWRFIIEPKYAPNDKHQEFREWSSRKI